MARKQFHLSLRDDDDYELTLWQAMKELPHGMSKQFFIRAVRMMSPYGCTVPQMASFIRDFVLNARPLALKELPAVELREIPKFRPNPETETERVERFERAEKRQEQRRFAYADDAYDGLSVTLPAAQ